MMFSKSSGCVASVATALCIVLLTPSLALAEGAYVGASYSRFEFTDAQADDEIIRPDGITLRLGIEPVNWLGLEARGGIGIDSDKRSFSGGSLAFDLDELYGAYVKLGLPLGDAVMPYAIAGYTHAEGSAAATLLGVSSTDSQQWDDQSLGGGLDINVSNSLALNLEYMRYIDTRDQELSAVSIGLRSAF